MFAPQPHTALEGLADAVRAAGVTKVTGNVVGDDGRYDDLRTVESWDPDDLSNGEVGPLSALSVNDARDRTNGGDLDDIVSGAISDPAADPPAHAAEVLRELLIARGVVVEGAFASGEAPDQARQIAAVDSLPVKGLVAQMLQFSDNNTAELLLKEVGRERSGVGSTAAGIKVELELLKEWGISTEGVVIVDASGLSGADRVTCTLLRRVLDHGEADGLLAKVLAVP
jgi:D-alanyl-D-alanine carboxypeptidase/D-alanyl-D-alanine-endopeptidase (penicillin-binding protein 4)